jgi:hypothetical protein
MRLARALFPGPNERLIGLVAALLTVPAAGTFASISTLDALVLNRTVVLAVELYALAWACEGRPARALLAAGLAANVHVTTAGHAAILIVTAGLVLQGWRATARAVPWFFVGAAPLAVMYLGGGGSGVPYPTPERWWQIVKFAWPFHHFPSEMQGANWLNLAFPSVLLVGALAARPSRAAWGLALGILGACALGAVLIVGLRHPLGVQLHLYESTRFLNYVAYAAVAAMALDERRPSSARIAGWLAIAIALGWPLLLEPWRDSTLGLAIAALAIVAACAVVARRARGPATPPRPPPRALLLVLAVGVGYAYHWLGDRRPFTPTFEGTAVALERDCWETPRIAEASSEAWCGVELMRWAREATPPTARFLTPPYWIHPSTSWRAITRRGQVVTFKDGGEALFSLEFADAWRERYEAVTGAPMAFHGERGHFWIVFWTYLNDYRRRTSAQLVASARRFGATYVVVERHAPPPAWTNGEVLAPPTFDAPPVYEDAAFRVYAVPPAPAAAAPTGSDRPAR